METFVFIGSSVVSSFAAKTATAPLERIKVLKQSQLYYTEKNYHSLHHSVKHIIQQEGWKGLFKGNMVNIVRTLPAYMIKFPMNDITKKYVMKYRNKTSLNFSEKLYIGLFTGGFQILITYPMDFLKTRISLDKQMSSSVQNNSLFQYSQMIMKKEGIMGFYRGFSPAILTYPIYVGLQMSLFYQFREKQHDLFTSGVMAGIISQTIAYPGDTIKKQMQNNGLHGEKKYNHIIHCIRSLYFQYGIRGFYTGLSINLLKCMPGSAIQFAVYEWVKNKGLNYLNSK